MLSFQAIAVIIAVDVLEIFTDVVVVVVVVVVDAFVARFRDDVLRRIRAKFHSISRQIREEN